MVRAQPRQLGEGRERDVIGNTFLDIRRHSLLLPTRKAATTDRPSESSAIVDANEFVRQHDAECFGVLPVHRARVLDLRLKLENGLPETAIVKEQARLEFDLAEPQRGIDDRPPPPAVETHCPPQRSRFLPTPTTIPSNYQAQ